MNGMTGMSPNIDFVIDVTGPMISGVSGDGWVGGIGAVGGETSMPVSATAAMIFARTSSAVTFGNTRQLTNAVATCGRALSACPPESRVATHVVRSTEL